MELDNKLAKLDKTQIKFLSVFTSDQYDVIRNFWKKLIANYSQKCYVKLFGKLTKKIGELKTQGKLKTTH